MRIHLDKFDEFKNMKVSINDKYGAEEEKPPEIEHQCANCDFTMAFLVGTLKCATGNQWPL
jgi:hypothetical protein